MGYRPAKNPEGIFDVPSELAPMKRIIQVLCVVLGGPGEPEIWCHPSPDRDSVERYI